MRLEWTKETEGLRITWALRAPNLLVATVERAEKSPLYRVSVFGPKGGPVFSATAKNAPAARKRAELYIDRMSNTLLGVNHVEFFKEPAK